MSADARPALSDAPATDEPTIRADTRCWVAVASAGHVRRGLAEGFMQVCHGKRGPLARIQPGDRVVYYSPSEAFRGSDKLQSFTAIGEVKTGTPYQVDMGDGFRPFRRDVAWLPGQVAPIRPLLQDLAFTATDRNWGYKLRFGLFEIPAADFAIIEQAMGLGAA